MTLNRGRVTTYHFGQRVKRHVPNVVVSALTHGVMRVHKEREREKE
jgi:hypothetical protein